MPDGGGLRGGRICGKIVSHKGSPCASAGRTRLKALEIGGQLGKERAHPLKGATMPHSNGTESAVRNLTIRQTWLEDQVADILSQYDCERPHEAFQALAMGLLFDLDYDAIQPYEIVGGGQEKQIDVIRIDDDQDRGFAHIHIMQAKYRRGFGSNTVIMIRNGLDWIFERPRTEYEALDNQALVNRIGEIRQLRLDYGTSSIAVSVYHVTTGDTQGLSDEYLGERKILVDKYSNVGFSEFNFHELGAFELVELLNAIERAGRRIDVDVSVVYDVNMPSLIQYSTGDTKALICTVTGSELARVASAEPRDAIFDLNVRPFYGSRGRVNKDILHTCTSEGASRFWFLNNGITMTCDRFDVNRDPDETSVKVVNAQIVNGCQTTVTLREASERGELRDDVRILLRIYATDNPRLAELITLTTNSQNRITDRDLRSNDVVQIDIQRFMEENYGYFYERKNKQYRGYRGEQKKRIVPNYRAAQSYLAIVRHRPSMARGYLGKIWSDFYKEIFDNATVHDLLASFLIHRYCEKKARSASRDASLPRVKTEVAVYGTFHLARICGYLLFRDQWRMRAREPIETFIGQMENDEEALADVYDKAFGILVPIREQSAEEHPNPALYFKAGDVQKRIAQTLAAMPR